jgi:hypothetical protein
MKTGIVPEIEKEGRRVYVDESYVAYCVEVYLKNSWRRRVRIVFDKNGILNLTTPQP